MPRKLLLIVLISALAVGCSCSDDTGTDGGVDADGDVLDGSGSRMDGDVPDAGTGVDGALPFVDGSTEIPCQGHVYACGDTMDNDDDGLTDAADPDCLGPCDNNEGGYYLEIPGGDSAPCRLDCYFDQDQGSGNDGCEWDHRCDPLEPDLNPMCAFRDPPPPSANCPDPQDPRCAAVCGPLVPNGCDCFGCCNLPAGSSRFVFIGSVDRDGTPTCTLEEAENDAACHPCTPVSNCLNECGMCELCLGRTELPPGCLPDAGPEPDGGRTDGGIPAPMCDDGRTSCGLPGLPPCPDGFFCITGCCINFG